MSKTVRKIDPVSRGEKLRITHCQNGGWLVWRGYAEDEGMYPGDVGAFSDAKDLLGWLGEVFNDNPPEKK